MEKQLVQQLNELQANNGTEEEINVIRKQLPLKMDERDKYAFELLYQVNFSF